MADAVGVSGMIAARVWSEDEGDNQRWYYQLVMADAVGPFEDSLSVARAAREAVIAEYERRQKQ